MHSSLGDLRMQTKSAAVSVVSFWQFQQTFAAYLSSFVVVLFPPTGGGGRWFE